MQNPNAGKNGAGVAPTGGYSNDGLMGSSRNASASEARRSREAGRPLLACVGEGRTEPTRSSQRTPKASLADLSGDQLLVIDGYNIRILTAQGDDAPGGTMNYIADGKMTGGFAILTTPVKYAETGVMTFMTGSDGIV